jgi:bacillithiol system protein YtxJ
MLVVQEARSLSNEVAARFSIRHESPQAILFRGGTPVGSLHHEEITLQRLAELLGSPYQL